MDGATGKMEGMGTAEAPPHLDWKIGACDLDLPIREGLDRRDGLCPVLLCSGGR